MRSLPLVLAIGLLACADLPGPDTPDLDGKADADRVAQELARVTADGELSADDVDALFEAAGGSVSMSEMLVIRDATEETTDFKVTDGAVDRAFERAYLANLFDKEVDLLADPAAPTYGGSEIPAAVRELVARARLNGAATFDIREQRGDGEGRWTPYPSTSPPIGNMAFDYTEITPAILAADVADTTVKYNAITGIETAEQCNTPTDCFEFEQVTYEERTGGTGNVAAQFDEVHHPDLFARGSQNQKWANNCAILSDGTFHCLPAARRSVLRDLILTNPHLSRCNQVPGSEDCRTIMYLGHIDISGGVVTGVEVSGRVSKRVGGGAANLIDPIALMEAWGFEMSPSLRLRFGNTEDGTPQRNLERGVLEAPKTP